jgi:hypothetical protein
MKRLSCLIVLSLLALTAACDKAAAFRSAVPSRSTVQMRVPGLDDGGAIQQALSVGEQAPLYGETVKIATAVNTSVALVFKVIEEILRHPPTSVEDDVAVWGPSEPRGLERLSFRFTVERLDEEHFAYRLEARLKGETSEEAFVEVFAGETLPGDDNDGTGTLVYHLGSLRSLGAEPCLTGDIEIAYDAASEPRTLDVVFTETANECAGERPTNARYAYAENEDKSGLMDFAFRANVHKPEENKPEKEVLSVRSRWLSSGAGRSDVRVAEGEIPADLLAYIPETSATTVDVVECWDDSFALVHADTTPDELEPHLDRPNVGDASLCVFAEASFANL